MSDLFFGCLAYPLLFWLVYQEAKKDAVTIKADKPIDHQKGSIRRAWMVAVCAVLVVAGRQKDIFNLGWTSFTLKNAVLVICCTLFLKALWWLLFDLTLNRLRGLPWDYTGALDNKDDAFSDDVLHFFPRDLRLPIKLLLLGFLAWLVYRPR